MNYIKRKLETKILKFLKTPEIIAIIGPRQSGKTTLLQKIISTQKKACSISFEDREILQLFENNIKEFIDIYVKNKKYLFIDEFQYAKKGGKNLKFIFDTEKIKIIISGSSAPDITIKAIKYLVGRVLILELFPFDFEEFLLAQADENYLEKYKDYKKNLFNKKISISPILHKKFLSYYENYLIFGGYPRVVLEKNKETKKEILKNIYSTYFLREVRDMLGLIEDYKLEKLIKALCLQIGNLINYEELSTLSGYSFLTVKKYLNFLEKSYILNLTKPFFANKRNEIIKNNKVFLLDSGLRNAIVNDFRDLDSRSDKGALLENGLAEQFIKNNLFFNFWRDKKKNEIDFIVDYGNGKKIAIESKSHLKQSTKKIPSYFAKNYPDVEFFYSYENLKSGINSFSYPIYLF